MDSACAQEQQRLEERMAERMKQPGAQGGPHRLPQRGQDQPYTNADEHDADVLYAMEGQHALHVVLHGRVQHAQNRRQQPECQDQGIPPGRAATEHVPGRPSKPYTPTFSITPDISVETWLGATGWARGSHTRSGITPALVPHPTSASRNTTTRTPARSTSTATTTNAVPRRVIARYTNPARRTSAIACSWATSKYEATAINSHASRKPYAPSASRTTAVDARNRFVMAARRGPP